MMSISCQPRRSHPAMMIWCCAALAKQRARVQVSTPRASPNHPRYARVRPDSDESHAAPRPDHHFAADRGRHDTRHPAVALSRRTHSPRRMRWNGFAIRCASRLVCFALDGGCAGDRRWDRIGAPTCTHDRSHGQAGACISADGARDHCRVGRRGGVRRGSRRSAAPPRSASHEMPIQASRHDCLGTSPAATAEDRGTSA